MSDLDSDLAANYDALVASDAEQSWESLAARTEGVAPDVAAYARRKAQESADAAPKARRAPKAETA